MSVRVRPVPRPPAREWAMLPGQPQPLEHLRCLEGIFFSYYTSSGEAEILMSQAALKWILNAGEGII